MLRPLLACLAFAVCGCATQAPVKEYTRPLPTGASALVLVPQDQWPELGAALGNPESLRQAVVHSLEFLSRPSSQQRFPVAGVSHERMQRSLQSFLELLDAGLQGSALDAALRQRFELYRSRGWDGSGEVLFTAYCEPIYAGSRTPSETYRYPLYSLPPDLVKDAEGNTLGRQTDAGLVPYPARRELESSGMLQGLELVYLENPFDPFVVHVQGSARIRLAEGGELRIGYAGKNGQPYTSIGKLLVEQGKIPGARISLQAIRDYLAAHPQELQGLLWQNASFVFFTETEGGPYGSLNVPVIGGRSLATDRDIFPAAGLCFVETSLPFAEGTGFVFRRFAGFMCNQDTGGAIRSPGRADLFLGSGPEAERRAGHTKQEGQLYFLLAAGGAR